MRRKMGVEVISQPQGYFYELVTDAVGKQKIEIARDTEAYLVNLLSQFVLTDNLYPRDREGRIRDEPLALLLKEAIDEPQEEFQRLLFRQIGDFSLYMGGFFQDSLSRKLVDLDYYIGVGGQAYAQVAARAVAGHGPIYRELAEKFATLVELFAAISDATSRKSEKDILRLYETWVRTRSERAARALKDAGILPNQTIKKDWQ